MKKAITNNERLQLLGLLTLGIKYRRLIEQVEQSMADIVEDEPGNLLSDALWDENADIDKVLANMQIEVSGQVPPDDKANTGSSKKPNNPTNITNTELELKEKLAAIEHERWADWQKWCHKILRENGLPSNLEPILERWEVQISKSYKELSDKEKASDMEQVDRYWPIIQAYVTKEIVKELENLLANKAFPQARSISVKKIESRIATVARTNYIDYPNTIHPVEEQPTLEGFAKYLRKNDMSRKEKK